MSITPLSLREWCLEAADWYEQQPGDDTGQIRGLCAHMAVSYCSATPYDFFKLLRVAIANLPRVGSSNYCWTRFVRLGGARLRADFLREFAEKLSTES